MQPVRAVDDDLRLAVVHDDVRRRPGGGLVARPGATVRLPVAASNAGDEVGVLVVPGDDERRAVDGRASCLRRTPLRVRISARGPSARATVPVDVERVEAARAEEGVDARRRR